MLNSSCLKSRMEISTSRQVLRLTCCDVVVDVELEFDNEPTPPIDEIISQLNLFFDQCWFCCVY